MIKPTRFSKPRYALVVGLILCVYVLNNLNFLDRNMINSILIPVIWLLIGAMVWFFPVVRPIGKLRTRRGLYFWAFNFAFIMITVQIIAGLIDGLGKSPYNHSLPGVFYNIYIIGTALFGRELARHYLVNSITREENYGIFIGLAAFMTVISFPVEKLVKFQDFEGLVMFIAQFFAPELTKNLLATVLVFYGGPLSSVIFFGMLDAFKWLSPVLPDLQWLTAALVGILTPVFLLGVQQVIYEDESKIHKRKNKYDENPINWIITTLFVVGIVWFSVGVFPIYPSVVATGSMLPAIQPGDVIMVNKNIDTNQLRIGQVIQFRRENILISHRIIEVVEKDGIKSYKTQGDNNTGPDKELVKPENVKGEIIKVVPKVGWPTLMVKNKSNIPLDDIEF